MSHNKEAGLKRTCRNRLNTARPLNDSLRQFVCLSLERTIPGRCRRKESAEEFGKASAPADSASAGNLVDREVGFNEKAATLVEPYPPQIIGRAQAHFHLEAAQDRRATAWPL
jgi:hypothetical protein